MGHRFRHWCHCQIPTSTTQTFFMAGTASTVTPWRCRTKLLVASWPGPTRGNQQSCALSWDATQAWATDQIIKPIHDRDFQDNDRCGASVAMHEDEIWVGCPSNWTTPRPGSTVDQRGLQVSDVGAVFVYETRLAATRTAHVCHSHESSQSTSEASRPHDWDGAAAPQASHVVTDDSMCMSTGSLLGQDRGQGYSCNEN